MGRIGPQRMFKVQYLAFPGTWLDLTQPMTMASCKAHRAFMEQAEEPLTLRTLLVLP